MAPKLHLVGKGGSSKVRDTTLISSLIVFVLAMTYLGITTYLEYRNSPVGTAEIFVKALMNGNSQKIDEINYTKSSGQTIKANWSYILEDYEFSDLVFTQSDEMSHRVHVITKDGKVKLTIDTAVMNEHRYVKYLSP